jgi:hypothetical protein
MRTTVPLDLLKGAASVLESGPVAGTSGRGAEAAWIPPAQPTRARSTTAPATSAPDKSRPRSSAAPIPYTRTEIVDPSVAPFRTQGKLFGITGGGIAFDCSATAVSSQNRSVVFTAGHCVFDETGWARLLNFVPGYRDGGRPYGEWPALSMHAPPQWTSFGSSSFDMASIVVAARSDGVRLEDLVGGRGIAWNIARSQQFDAFGYPGTPPFDGERLHVCDSTYGWDDIGDTPPPMAIGCDMKEGASGGGWIIRDNYLNSHTTHGYPREPEVVYGPYFGNSAGSLYQTASTSSAPGPLPPTPPAQPLVGQEHRITLTLRLIGHLFAAGQMRAQDGYAPCTRGAPVSIFRKSGGGWNLLKQVHTGNNGTFRTRVKDVPGTYRAASPQGAVDDVNVCGFSQTVPRKHRH